MLIKVTQVESKWKSDDGQREIWELVNGLDGTGWATMSKKIADSVGQTMELTTRVSKGGKTYLVQPPKEGYPGSPAQASPEATDGLVARLEAAVEALEQSVQDATRLLSKEDKIVTEIPKDVDDALSKAIDVFGDGATIEG